MRGRLYVNLKCPVCEKIFTIPKNKSFLNKHNKLNCNCCSPKCRGKLSKEIQKFGLTDNIKKSINENFIEEYRVYSNE